MDNQETGAGSFPVVEISQIPGVVSVVGDMVEQSVVVQFKDGVIATVKRSPLARFAKGESFNVWLPSTRGPDFPSDVALGKTAAEVVGLLNELAAKAS